MRVKLSINKYEFNCTNLPWPPSSMIWTCSGFYRFQVLTDNTINRSKLFESSRNINESWGKPALFWGRTCVDDASLQRYVSLQCDASKTMMKLDLVVELEIQSSAVLDSCHVAWTFLRQWDGILLFNFRGRTP